MSAPVASADPADVRARPSPYQGLVPYTERDAEWFFGRDEWAEVLADNFRAYRVTVLYGASGVGKSSLLRAGLIRRLADGARESVAAGGAPRLLPVAFASWSRDDPVAALKDAVREAAERLMRDRPWQPPEGELADVLGAWPALVGGQLLLVLDQLEELFTYHEGGDDSVLAQLTAALRRRDPAVHFLLSIRGDALASLDHFKGQVSGLGEHLLRLEHLDRQAAREAIVQPLERWNRTVAAAGEEVEIEPALVEAVLEQVTAGKVSLGGGDGGGLREDHAGVEAPYLQLVLTHLWDEERRSGSSLLRLQTLERLGGADEIVRTHLDAALAELPEQDQDLAGRAFRYLVTPSGTKVAYRTADLAEYTQMPPERIEHVVTLLAGKIRVLRPAGDGRHEIYHDALAGPIADWRARWEGRQRRRRERRRLAILAGLAAGLAGIAVAIGILAVIAWQARGDARTGQSQALAGQAMASVDTDAPQALRDSVKAAETARTSQAEAALRRTLAGVLPRKTLRGHRGAVRSAAFSPDGRLVVTAGDDGTARIWDRAGGRLLHTLIGHEGPVTSAAFSPDGDLVVTGGYDGTARVWSTGRGDLLKTLEGHEELVFDAAFNRQGDSIVTASADGSARIWDTRSGELVRRLGTGHGPVFSASFSPDGGLVLTASGYDGSARLWRVATGGFAEIFSGHLDKIETAVFSPDGRLVVTGGRDGTALIHSFNTGAVLHPLGGHEGSVFAAAFNSDGSRIVTAGSDGTARLWDSESGRLVRTLGSGGTVFAAAFSRDGELVTAGDDGTARLWDVEREAPSHGLRDSRGVYGAVFDTDGRRILATDGTAGVWTVSGDPVHALGRGHVAAVSRDGRLAVASREDGTVQVWDTTTGIVEVTLIGLRGLKKASFSPDGSLLVTAGSDGRADVWDARTGRRLHELGGAGGAEAAVAFSPDGELVLTAGGDLGTVRLWNVASGRRLDQLEATATLRSASFSRDGKLVVAVGDSGIGLLWDIESGRLLQALKGHDGTVWSADFSPDATLVVTAGDDGTARLWEAASGRRLRTLGGHESTVASAVFSPDGKLVLTASHDQTARLWETDSGHLLRTLRGHVQALYAAAFSADGTLIVTAGEDGARSWSCDVCGVGIDELLARAKARLASGS